MCSEDCFLSAAGVAFTSSKIFRAVEKVERLWGNYKLAWYLSVPASKQNEIKRVSSSAPKQRKLLIQYWMEHDPRASWRGLIVALDAMKEKQTADNIRHLAEPVTGTAGSWRQCGCALSYQH